MALPLPTSLAAAVAWHGFAASARTPKLAIEKLNATIQDIMDDPEMKMRITEMGAMPMASSTAEFATFLAAEIKKNAEAVRRANVKVD